MVNFARALWLVLIAGISASAALGHGEQPVSVPSTTPSPAPMNVPSSAPPSSQPPLDWKANEPLLSQQVQLTFPSQFTRAGEAYLVYATPPRWIAFQATARPVPVAIFGPTGQDTLASPATATSPHYAMYVARRSVTATASFTSRPRCAPAPRTFARH